tara:strand:+ start:93 stop:779 length:687 start_codon:yes stop_codon:yes gene_type:complete
MATSAETLSKIIKELVKYQPGSYDAALTLLSTKGYLPKKLTEPKPVKKTTQFASKAAEEFYRGHAVVIPDGFKGTALGHKISVKDLKQLDEGPKKVKVNASPTALQFCRDNGLDITKVKGTGLDCKVLLKDVKDLKPSASAQSVKRKISPKAAQLIKEYGIDDDDVESIEGTGVNGTIKECDVLPLCVDSACVDSVCFDASKKKKKKKKSTGNQSETEDTDTSDAEDD